jgi:hypothetical protein
MKGKRAKLTELAGWAIEEQFLTDKPSQNTYAYVQYILCILTHVFSMNQSSRSALWMSGVLLGGGAGCPYSTIRNASSQADFRGGDGQHRCLSNSTKRLLNDHILELFQCPSGSWPCMYTHHHVCATKPSYLSFHMSSLT